MNEITWVIVTAVLLGILWLWKGRKANLLADSTSAGNRITTGLYLLLAWSILNLLKTVPAVANDLDETAVILLDSLSIAMLIGSALLLGITFLVDIALVRIRINPGRKSVSFTELMEKTAAISVNDSEAAFIRDTSEILARELRADYCQISRSKNSERTHVDEYSLQHDLEVEDSCRFKMLNGDLSPSDKKLICRRHKQIRIHLSNGQSGQYELVFCVPKSQRTLRNPDHRQVLQSVLNSKLENAAQNEKAYKRLEVETSQNRLFIENDRASDIASYLRRIYPILSEKVKFDYISIAVLDSAIQNMYRHTYAEVGGSLIERGICYPLKQTSTLKAAGEARMMVANTLESDFYRDDYHLYKSGFSSRLVYPVRDNSGHVLAVLTLAAVKPKAFNHLSESDLEFLNAPLCHVIEYNNVNSMMNTLKKQIVSSFSLTFGLENSPGLKGFYDRSARILAETLPATMCRIWGYDRSSNRLRPIGYHSLHHREVQKSDLKNEVQLELMPRHKAAIKMGKAIIVNQSNPESNMGKSEIECIGLPGIKSAILAPMRLQNRISGIVSVGEVRNWERRSLGQQELLYCQIISTMAALVHEVDSKSLELNKANSALTDIGKQSQVYQTYPNLPSRISSKLSGIMGAAELMRRRMPEDAGDMIRYNNIIIRGAERIAEEIRKFGELKNNILQDK